MGSSTSDPAPQLVALVTGASDGIGRELAHVLAEHGHALVLVARRGAVLDTLARELHERHGVPTWPLVADLADPEAPAHIMRVLAERALSVDVLVNNAGFGESGAFHETPLARELEMIQVNVAALTALTKECLPAMRARRRGRILNLGSTASFEGGPHMVVYYATKAYVLSFSEGLAEELRGSGVTCTALCPGPTRTSFARVARTEHNRVFSSSLVMDARPVAEYGYAAMMRGKPVAVAGLWNRLGVFGLRLIPRRWATAIVRRAHGDTQAHA